MPVISSLTPVTTVLPLIFVLLVSGLKDLVDDYVSIFFPIDYPICLYTQKGNY